MFRREVIITRFDSRLPGARQTVNWIVQACARVRSGTELGPTCSLPNTPSSTSESVPVIACAPVPGLYCAFQRKNWRVKVRVAQSEKYVPINRC